MTWRLSRRAHQDLVDIYITGALEFGEPVASAYHGQLRAVFAMLAQFPQLARERAEVTPPIRIHPFGSHLVVYTVEPDGSVLIVRIRHAHEDWACE